MTFLAAIWSETVYLVPAWKRRTAVLSGLSSSCGSGAYAEFMFFQPFLPVFHQLRVGSIFIGLLPLNLLGRTLWFFQFFLFGYVEGHHPVEFIEHYSVELSAGAKRKRLLGQIGKMSGDRCQIGRAHV